MNDDHLMPSAPMTVPHSPTPWNICQTLLGSEKDVNRRILRTQDGRAVCAINWTMEEFTPQMKADASFIATATHYHDKLTDALRTFLNARPQCPCESPDCAMSVARTKAKSLLTELGEPLS